MQRHQLGGILLAVATTVLLSVATFSTPFSTTVYFLRAATSTSTRTGNSTSTATSSRTTSFVDVDADDVVLDEEIRFGAFGWCLLHLTDCAPLRGGGNNSNSSISGISGNSGSKECWGPVLGYHWDPEITVWLTRAEITIGLAALPSLTALLSLILEITLPTSYILTNPLWFRTSAVLTCLLALVGFVGNTVVWYNTRVRFGRRGVEAEYGPALWILLGGTISAALSLCVGGPRFTGRHMYRAHNQASYTV